MRVQVPATATATATATTTATATATATALDGVWSAWGTGQALESHVKCIRRSLCVAVSLVATMDIHR